MENGSSMSPADVVALTNGGAGSFGGFEGIIYLALIAGLFGGFGGFGFGGGNAAAAMGYATQSDMQRGFDFQNSMANQRETLGAVTAGTAQAVAATNQTFHDTLGVLTDKYSELQRDIAAVGVQNAQIIGDINNCCTSTKMMIADAGANLSAQIAQNKYENALALAGMEQRITAKMDANEIQALRDQISQLQMAQATNGLVRFPNSYAYNAGQFPPFVNGCGCGCGCNV